MKTPRIIIIVLFSFSCITLNAQLFIGGSIGINTSTHDYAIATTPHKTSNYDISLMPNVGKFLSDNIAIGLNLDLSFTGYKSNQNLGTKSNSTTFGFSPFLRYYAFKWNKFSLFGEGNIGMQFSYTNNKTAGVTTDSLKNTIIYLSIRPGFSYDITDRISLETSINIFSLGYNYIITKNGSLRDKASSLNFGAGLGNILNIGSLTIGGIFKF